MEIINIRKEKYKLIGKNEVGNVYKYKWFVYAKDDRKEPYGLQQRINGKDINIKEVFVGTKPEVKRWLKDRNIEWNFKDGVRDE